MPVMETKFGSADLLEGFGVEIDGLDELQADHRPCARAILKNLT